MQAAASRDQLQHLHGQAVLPVVMVVVMAEKLKPDVFSLVSNYKVAKVGGPFSAGETPLILTASHAAAYACSPVSVLIGRLE
jgi:hypothetical protein